MRGFSCCGAPFREQCCCRVEQRRGISEAPKPVSDEVCCRDRIGTAGNVSIRSLLSQTPAGSESLVVRCISSPVGLVKKRRDQ